MKKEYKYVAYGILALLVIGVAYAFLKQANKVYQVSVKPEEATAKQVQCDVSVFNPIGIPLIKNGDLYIESVNCQQQYVSNCARFGLFSDTGTLVLQADGGIGDSKDVKVSENGRTTATLGWCGSKITRNFNIKLYDDNNQLLQTKTVNLP